MGNADRDAIFWATVAIVEQDFDGAGDLCIRCHNTGGWDGGRSTPTDGSRLASSNDDGVDCDACHSMTNTDNSEHLGVMNALSPPTARTMILPITAAIIRIKTVLTTVTMVAVYYPYGAAVINSAPVLFSLLSVQHNDQPDR